MLPDPNSPLDHDIGGCLSPSVTILSKRNRNQGANRANVSSNSVAAANPSGGGGGGGGGMINAGQAAMMNQQPTQAAIHAANYQAALAAASKPPPLLNPLPNPTGTNGVQGGIFESSHFAYSLLCSLLFSRS